MILLVVEGWGGPKRTPPCPIKRGDQNKSGGALVVATSHGRVCGCWLLDQLPPYAVVPAYAMFSEGLQPFRNHGECEVAFSLRKLSTKNAFAKSFI